MGVIINPGTGRVVGAYAKDAWKNVRTFRRDLAVLGLVKPKIEIHRVRDDDDDGRYGFRLERGICTCEISMPGLPLDRVRWLRLPDQNIWHFPRLYVDGSSWVWFYALNQARSALLDHDGSIAKLVKKEARAVARELRDRPVCGDCGAYRSEASRTDDNDVAHPYVRCYACEPSFYSTTRGNQQVRMQLMPPDAPSGELCNARVSWQGTDYCRRRRGHDGQCEGYYKIVRE